MLAHGSIGSALFKLSAPAIIGMVVIAIYNVVDTFFVSLLRDTTLVAATGIVFPIFQLVGAVGLTFGMGAASVVSRRIGAGDTQAANEAAATAIYSVVVIGAVVSALGATFAGTILGLFGATPSIIGAATLYGRIIIGGSIFQMINMTVNNIVRAEGASMYSSAGQILGAGLNIILDPIFIFVLDMGITGAAVATVISQAVSMLWILGFYFRRQGVLNPLLLRNVRLRGSTYGEIMNLGLPTLVRQLLGSVSFAILNNAAAVYGDKAIAAISVTQRLFMLLMMTMIGLSQGLQPLAGYNYGARRYDRVHATIRLVFTISTGFGLVVGVAAFIFAAGIMRIFVPQDAEVIAMGVRAIRLTSFSLVPTGLVIMFGGIFQALGDGRSALGLAVGQQGAFLIPLVIFLPRLIGLDGVFAAQPAGFILTFLIGVLLYKRSSRAMSRLEQKKLEEAAAT